MNYGRAAVIANGVLAAISSGGYAWVGDWRRAVYWFAVVIIDISLVI